MVVAELEEYCRINKLQLNFVVDGSLSMHIHRVKQREMLLDVVSGNGEGSARNSSRNVARRRKILALISLLDIGELGQVAF